MGEGTLVGEAGSWNFQRTEACDEICDVSPPSFTLPATENPCTCSHTAPQLLVTSVCVRLQEAPSPQCSHWISHFVLLGFCCYLPVWGCRDWCEERTGRGRACSTRVGVCLNTKNREANPPVRKQLLPFSSDWSCKSLLLRNTRLSSLYATHF